MFVLIHNSSLRNETDESVVTALLAEGGRIVTEAEIADAGLTGYEHLVCPDNSVVLADGTISFTPPDLTASAEDLATQARAQRDALIAACDWTMLPDAPLTHAAREAWTTYRQALRDVPQQVGFPADVQWPEAPATVMELDGSV